MTPTLLTCVIPVYRGAAVLPHAVQSVLAQALPTGVVLVDDASDDDSWTVVQQLAAAHPQRIRAVRLGANQGQASARNMGAGLATTPYLAFLDQDDSWAEGFAQACVGELQRRPALAAVKTAIDYVGLPASMAIAPGEARDRAMVSMHGGNMVIRHEVFWALGGFATDAVFRGPLAGEDSALQRSLQAASTVGLLPQPLFRYHWRAGNVLDRFASRTRSDGAAIRFDHLMPEESSGLLENALRAHVAQALQRSQRLLALLQPRLQPPSRPAPPTHTPNTPGHAPATQEEQ